MYKCQNCTKELRGQIYIGNDGEGVYCDAVCYLEWYAEHYDLGYYISITEYEEHIRELEKKYSWDNN